MIAFRNVTNLDYVHSQVHAGNYFTVSHFFAGIAAGASFDLLLICGAKEAHCISAMSFQGDLKIQLFEAPTITLNGTALPCVNHHREGVLTLVAAASAFFSPTIAITGTQLLDRFSPATGAGQAVASNIRQEAEWNLAPNTAYLFRGVNDSVGAGDGESVIEFYEIEQ